MNAVLHFPAPAVPAVKFCQQCGTVTDKAHADCRGHLPAQFTAPPCPRGMFEFWHRVAPGVQLVCHLCLDPGEPSTETSPAYPASANLYHAYLHGTDITDCLLTDDQIDDIEELALREATE